MPTVSARVPEDLEEELEAYLREENLDRSVAIRKLLAEALRRWERERAVRRFADGEVSFARAAALARMDLWEFAAFLREQKVPWVDEEGVLKDLGAT